MRLTKYKIFSDFQDDSDYFPIKNKADKEFVEFYNKHPYIKILNLTKRQMCIQNCGNGTAYYNIDLIFAVDKKYCYQDDWENWELKEEENNL